MQTYTVALEKGGAGKTAIAVNLAAALHQAGLAVLLIDLDAQTSATHWLGINAAAVSLERSVFGAFSEAISGRGTAHSIIDRALRTKDGVHVLPAHDHAAAPDPHRVLGVPHDASPAQIRAAYRALLRALHPDTRAEPADPARLAQVVAAHAQLRDAGRRETPPSSAPPSATGTPIPVRVRSPRAEQPDIRVGPVRSR
jgi:DnaJ-domain-containing protein 1